MAKKSTKGKVKYMNPMDKVLQLQYELEKARLELQSELLGKAKEKGFTQMELADKCGVSQSEISHSRYTLISIPTLQKIYNAVM